MGQCISGNLHTGAAVVRRALWRWISTLSARKRSRFHVLAGGNDNGIFAAQRRRLGLWRWRILRRWIWGRWRWWFLIQFIARRKQSCSDFDSNALEVLRRALAPGCRSLPGS